MRKSSFFASCLMVVSASAVGQERAQFDLNCSGQEVEIGKPNNPPKPWTNHYRFDLTTNTWCAGECSRTFAIKAVSEQKISMGDATVDRLSGKLTLVMVDPSSGKAIRINGSCEPSAFSGFPAKRF